MTISADPALVITDGGLAGLLACFIEGVCRPAAKLDRNAGAAGPAHSAAWFAIAADQVGQRDARRTAARRAAQLAHLSELVEWDGPTATPALDARARGEERSKLLIAAGHEALRRGLSRVVWPIQLGGPGGGDGAREPSSAWLDSVADACDRAVVCSRLLSLDCEGEGLTIQTPFVDFTDAQLADLAGDVDLPVEAAYYGSTEADSERWRKALAFAGLPMPALDAQGLSPTLRSLAGASRAASV